MAVVSGEAMSRPALIECMLDRRLLARYNEAAAAINKESGEHLATWSQGVIDGVIGKQ
jgi:hypothetical protein